MTGCLGIFVVIEELLNVISINIIGKGYQQLSRKRVEQLLSDKYMQIDSVFQRTF